MFHAWLNQPATVGDVISGACVAVVYCLVIVMFSTVPRRK